MDIFDYIREELLLEQEEINEGIKSVVRRVKQHLKDPLLRKAKARSNKVADRLDGKIDKLLFALKKGGGIKDKPAARQKLARLQALRKKSFDVSFELQRRQRKVPIIGKHL